ncbi:flagellar hook-associated protein FlgK [Gemmatimonas sp.]|uniref:flagellar hook-associated protein FlgK n=1 Tax=Gemmatimonas sp. TaxID=1962908 RepID=UPI0025C3E546|nr:flagellar hook-associated protein FlgK [Gemmatimonas sp.]MCA2989698.1 flagellar hook-associated protein FlgK [Gemmatimonas sp.]
MNTGLLSIARSALVAHQTALQTIAQNVANAETPGYSRQEAVLTANTPLRMPYGNVGTGVNVSTVVRKRDILLDESFRTANGQAGDAGMRRDLMQELEAVFGEPSDAGMTNALDQFWNAWSDLSAQPSSLAARAVVQQRGRQLGQLFNGYDTQLTTLRSSTLERLGNTVERISALATQVADLNVRIVGAESSGNSANDLRDLRDLKLDELSKLAGARALPQPDGTVSVLIGNSTLVDGATAVAVSMELEIPDPLPATPLTDLPVRIRLGNPPDRLFPLAGELKAMATVINTEIPGVRNRLDAMASQLVSAVNTAHSGGFTFTGSAIPGVAAGNFFDPGSLAVPVSAATLKLHSTIIADPSRIAASGNANAPTDNTVAQALSALRTAENTVSFTTPTGATETGSFVGFFRGLVTRVGLQTASAADEATVGTTLTDQADLRRQAVSGVSTDEELVKMLRAQQSFQAAAKMIKVAEEMLDTLVNLV